MQSHRLRRVLGGDARHRRTRFPRRRDFHWDGSSPRYRDDRALKRFCPDSTRVRKSPNGEKWRETCGGKAWDFRKRKRNQTKTSGRWGCVFFSPSTLPRRKVVTVVILQSSGIQFYVLLRMASTSVKKDMHTTSCASHIHRLQLWKLDGKAYTKQKPTQNKALQKTKAYKGAG